MAVLQSTNVQGSLCVNGVAVGGGKDFKYCCFTASTTWTPSQDLVDGDGVVDSSLVGAGGAGGFVGAYVCSQAYINRNMPVACSYGNTGGGGAFENDITDISATDACTVTIGAGGVTTVSTASPLIDSADKYYACDSLRPSASIGTGGDTTFGGITAHGGGGGGCLINFIVRSNYGETCQFKCTSGERNGGGYWSGAGGGADLRDSNYKGRKECVFAYSCGAPAYGGRTYCKKICDLGKDKITNRGDNYFNSSSYNFTPPQDCYACGFGGYGNDGIRLGTTRVGTNKHSIWECDPVQCTKYDGDQFNQDYNVTASNAINCGGGGGTSCICICANFNTSGPSCFNHYGGHGGDGLVILKWYE